MRRRKTRTIVLLALTAALAACGDDPVAVVPDPTVGGSWSGVFAIEGLQFTLDVTMIEFEDGTVTGNGTLSVDGGSIAWTISSGVHVFPDLSLILDSPGFESLSLTGQVSESAITAELNGSGFDEDVVILRRE